MAYLMHYLVAGGKTAFTAEAQRTQRTAEAVMNKYFVCLPLNRFHCVPCAFALNPPHPHPPYRLTNDSVTSPSRMPNLLIRALFSITRSFIKYIQSSNCTSMTRPSTGSIKV